MGEVDAMDTEISNETVEETGGEASENNGILPTTEESEGTKKEIEESDSVSFFPPAYLQRYCRVRELLKSMLALPKYKGLYSSTGKTVMEVGCAEFGMMNHFKSLLDITKIIFVDLDKDLLEQKLHCLKPLPAEYLARITRPQPLVVEAYGGCVTKVDRDLQEQNPNVWAVVGIEIIEHLHADVLRGFEETTFGIIAPHIVIVTTPNSDFNEVFKLPPGKFRHWDHKFEWSRKEFMQWCDKIVCEFQDYEYRIEGICEGPEETKHLGCVSQMAVFEKKESAWQKKDVSSYSFRMQQNCYNLLQSITFPNYIETRTTEEIILTEFEYLINTFTFSKSMLNDYEDQEINEVYIPLTRIQNLSNIEKIVQNEPALLKSVLEKGGYKIVSKNGEPSVLIKVDEYVAANLVEEDSDLVDDEEEISEDIQTLDINKIIEPDLEMWD